MSADRIFLEALEIDGHIGVYEHEHNIKQRLVVDIELHTDVREAAGRDELELSIDYDQVAEIVRNVVRSKHHHLIETLAEKIAAQILENFSSRVERVRVRVAKPGGVPDAKTVAVEIVRERQSS